jgi:soluble lytic murein transglycosylase-like protein
MLVGVLILSGMAGLARNVTADEEPDVLGSPAIVSELRSVIRERDALLGENEVQDIKILRYEAVFAYSSQHDVPANLAAAIYDIALSEGLEPMLAFRLVYVESRFTQRAVSHAGAVGYTQVMPSTARLYEPGLTYEQLFDQDTNLRLGFRYLQDLRKRYAGDLRLALLAYNRGPGKVQELLAQGVDPSNGYAVEVMGEARR